MSLILIIWIFTSPLTNKWLVAEERVSMPSIDQIEILKLDPRVIHIYRMINNEKRGEDLKKINQ